MIYRFISLETFLDVILSKSLTFVHPSLWEDPYEIGIFDMIDKSAGNLGRRIAININRKYIAAQSWTQLEESDALWRIYSHNKTSVRIAVKKENIEKLNDISMIGITYTDDLISDNEGIIIERLSKKRKAFTHEQEVRLFKNVDFNVFKENVESCFDPIDDLASNSEELIEKFLENKEVKKMIEKVSFSHIDNFIDSVMLNPFAQNYVDDTIREFCRINKLNYLGKSKLYEINEKHI